jgi:hypothetical protein
MPFVRGRAPPENVDLVLGISILSVFLAINPSNKLAMATIRAVFYLLLAHIVFDLDLLMDALKSDFLSMQKPITIISKEGFEIVVWLGFTYTLTSYVSCAT